MYKRCRLEEPQRLPLFIQDEFSVEVCCGIIRALQSFQTQVENFPLETSFKKEFKLALSIKTSSLKKISLRGMSIALHLPLTSALQ